MPIMSIVEPTTQVFRINYEYAQRLSANVAGFYLYFCIITITMTFTPSRNDAINVTVSPWQGASLRYMYAWSKDQSSAQANDLHNCTVHFLRFLSFRISTTLAYLEKLQLFQTVLSWCPHCTYVHWCPHIQQRSIQWIQFISLK